MPRATGDDSTLAAAVRRVDAEVSRLAALTSDAVVWRSGDREVLEAVGALARARGALDAVHLQLVRQVDERGVAQASPVATTPEGFLRTACGAGAGQARRDVAAARATAPGAVLEPFAAMLADGRCTRGHVDTAVRVLDRIPHDVLERPGAGQEIADYLVLAADHAAPKDLEHAGRHLLATLAPDPADRCDRQSVQRRFLDLATDATGMTVGRLQLDPVAGAALRTALARFDGPESGADGERDTRQPRQRRADALAFLAETAMAVQEPRRGERPRVVVHVTPEQLAGTRERLAAGTVGLADVEGGAPIPTWAARRLACDAVLQRVVLSESEGPVDLGRAVRLASVTQRRALAARDGGCVIPGCGAPPDICDAHHVVHWADGGPTDVCNMCLLCPAHHTAVHAGTWSVSIGPGQQVLVTPPRWVDPRCRPRPAWSQAARTARERLRRPAGSDDGVDETGPDPVDALGVVDPPPVSSPGVDHLFGPPAPRRHCPPVDEGPLFGDLEEPVARMRSG